MEIKEFRGPWRFLSNFYPSEVTYEGDVYPTAEHAYQAAKTEDQDVREEIRNLPTPGKARRFGRGVELFDGWEDQKINIMEAVLKDKFGDVMLRDLLLSTGSAYLEEGNNWGDKFWGTVDGEGLNWLGKLLMKIRKELGGA